MTEIPANAPKPQDRKPRKAPARKVAAAQAEAEDGYVTVTQCGVRLRIPIAGKIPLRAYLKFKDGDEIGGTELLLGPKQWEAFLNANPTLDDFAAIGDRIGELAGNSTASTA